MFTLTRAVPLNGPDSAIQITRQQIWKVLALKARDGRAFVPSITSCKVVEDGEDSFVRELSVNDGPPYRERVTLHNEKLIVFQHVDSPQTSVVLNQIETDEQGQLHLRYTYLLEFKGLLEGSEEEHARKDQLSKMPFAVDATLETARRMLAEGTL